MTDRQGKQVWAAATYGAAALFVGATAPAHADRLVLAGGDVVHGRLERIEKGGLRFLSDRFGPMAVEMGAVAELDVEGRTVVGFSNGDRIGAGRLRMEGSAVFVDSALGVVKVGIGDIVTVSLPVTANGGGAREPAVKERAGAQGVAALPPVPVDDATAAHEVSIGASVLGNQVSAGFAGARRTHVAAATMGYRRLFDGNDWVGLSVPVVYQVDRLSDLDGESRKSRLGLGDVFVHGHKSVDLGDGWPVLGIGAHASAPTGRRDGVHETTVLNLGSGHWAVGGSLDVTMPTGFGALTGGIGYTKYWPRTIDGERIAPAGEVSWSVGHSIQLNERVLLMNSFNGTIAGQSRTNGTPDRLSRTEPAYYEVSVAYAGDSGFVLRPQFALGLNTDARDYMVGLEIAKQW